jgi:hypothetical protein
MASPPGPEAEGGGGSPGMPRWVKILAIIAGVLLIVVIAHQLIGGGEHRPDRHLPSGSLRAVGAGHEGWRR